MWKKISPLKKSQTKEAHVKAVIHLDKYLQGTKEQALVINPNKDKPFEVWVDTEFTGNWNKLTAQIN